MFCPQRLDTSKSCVEAFSIQRAAMAMSWLFPLLEHLDSLLTGSGEALDLQTFKLVDQLSGRSMGLRADTTQQVARIDAHLLNRQV